MYIIISFELSFKFFLTQAVHFVNQTRRVVQIFVIAVFVLTILMQFVILMSVKIALYDILLEIMKSQMIVVGSCYLIIDFKQYLIA